MNGSLPVRVELARRAVTVAPEGEIDLATAPALWAAIDASITDRTARLVIDLADVTFIDSSGLKVVARARHRLPAPRQAVQIVNARPEVRRIINLAGFDKLVTVL